MIKCARFLLVLCFVSGISGTNAQTISHYFTQMPADLLPTVPANTRKDLIDFFQNGMTAAMPSTFGGRVVLKELTEDYLLLKTSESADIQLKLLPVSDTLRIIALVQTVTAPLKVSKILFFSTSWKPQDNISFPTFTYLDFLDIEKGKTLGLGDRFQQVCLRNFVFYTFKKNGYEMVAHSSIREDIRPEILSDFEPIIKDSLTFNWKNNSFNLQNLNK